MAHSQGHTKDKWPFSRLITVARPIQLVHQRPRHCPQQRVKPRTSTLPIVFADDIMLQTESIEHGQQMLDQTQAWCIANDMAVNIAKCGTFSNNASFHINGTADSTSYRPTSIWASRWARRNSVGRTDEEPSGESKQSILLHVAKPVLT